MKNLIIIIITVSCSIFRIVAQEKVANNQPQEVETLFGNNGSFGGFLLTGVKAGEVNGKSGLFVGGQISAVFSSKLNLGFAGYGLVTETDADTYSENDGIYKLDMGYGGLVIEPVIASRKLIHLTIPVLLGVGGSGLRTKKLNKKTVENDFDRDFEYNESDLFLVVEPGLNVELNLLRNIRLDIGVSYRQVHDSNLEGISDEELSGFAGNLGLKFGWF